MPDQMAQHVFANGLKTARVVKLIFHTVLWGGNNLRVDDMRVWLFFEGAHTHTHTLEILHTDLKATCHTAT